MNKVLKFQPADAINSKAHRKEGKAHYEYALICYDPTARKSKGVPFFIPVTIRTYRVGATAYACVWINDSKGNRHATGSAKAGGGGYAKETTAVEIALNRCGIELRDSIDGQGRQEIEDAVQAIGKFLGYDMKNAKVHVSHS